MESGLDDWILRGGRATVRPFTDQDIHAEYVGWLNDPVVVRFSNQRFVRHTEESCRRYLAGFVGTANRFLAIVDHESNRMIGTMSVYRNPHHRTADIGIMIGDRRYWGCGLGQEAFSLVVDRLLRSGEVRKVTAGTMLCNVGMVNVMERSGLKWEATRKGQELLDGAPVDVVYYSRFHDE